MNINTRARIWKTKARNVVRGWRGQPPVDMNGNVMTMASITREALRALHRRIDYPEDIKAMRESRRRAPEFWRHTYLPGDVLHHGFWIALAVIGLVVGIARLLGI